MINSIEETDMPRISIDVTSEQHERLKALAARRGQSLDDYVLARSLDEQPLSEDEGAALRQLKEYLEPRVREAEDGNLVRTDFKDIATEARKRLAR